MTPRFKERSVHNQIRTIQHTRIISEGSLFDRAPEEFYDQTCNLPPEEIAERDRPRSRQERRQEERLAAKGRGIKTVRTS